MIDNNIPISKNRPLDISISNMKSALDRLNIELIYQKEHNPTKNTYWINIAYKNAPKELYSNGKGISAKAALASALGEFVERLQTNNYFSEFYLPNNIYSPDQKLFSLDEDILDDTLSAIYNPDNLLENSDLIDFNSSYIDKVVALPFKKINSNNRHYFPLNILHNLYVSNGLATGNSMQEAKIQAISEIYERYVKLEVIKNGYSLPLIPKSILAEFKVLSNDIKELESLGYHIEVFDASLGGVFPVTAISIMNPKNATIFISFGSHPILEVSLERTFTELLQGRVVDNLDNFQQVTFSSDLVESSSNLESHFIDSNGVVNATFLSEKSRFKYEKWRYKGSNQEDEYNFLIDIANNLKKDIYYKEFNYLEFNSVQVIIPTLSEIYPIDDLIYNNRADSKYIREYILNIEKLNQDELKELLESIDNLEDSIDIGRYIGIIFKNPFTAAELKAQLYLLLKEYEEVSYLLEDSKNPTKHLVAQICTIYKNRLNIDDYINSFNKLYTTKRVAEAIDIFNSKKSLIDISFSKEYKDILDLYKNSIELRLRE